MYNEGGLTMIFGVLLSLGFVVFIMWYINTRLDNKLSEKKWLTKFVAVLLGALLGLFIVDKLVSWKVQLLSNEMSQGLFELIKNIVLIVFGYQFNKQVEKEDVA